MKTALKLALLYYGFQFIGIYLGRFIGIIYTMITTKNVEGIKSTTLSLSLFFSIVFMMVYLWKAGYISKEKSTWSPVSPLYLVLSVIICLVSIVILDYILSFLHWLPNISENTFNILQAGWLGIFCITIIGPILEELLFRGAITKILLQLYSPTKAIIISALIFGIFHINPVQVLSATFIGLLLAWIYYKTSSLIPCIVIHIVNNSLSVYFSFKFPDTENFKNLFSDSTNIIAVVASIIIFLGAFYLMNKITSASKETF